MYAVFSRSKAAMLLPSEHRVGERQDAVEDDDLDQRGRDMRRVLEPTLHVRRDDPWRSLLVVVQHTGSSSRGAVPRPAEMANLSVVIRLTKGVSGPDAPGTAPRS